MISNGNFDARRLLDQFLNSQAGGVDDASSRSPSAPQPGGAGAGSLSDLLGGLAGGVLNQGGSSTSGAGGDLLGRARDYLSGNGGSLASGAAAGALVSMVLGSKGGRKVAKNAVTLGGLALVGTLAYRAYRNYQQGQPPQDVAVEPVTIQQPAQLPPAQSPFHPASSAQGTLPVTLLRTMIAASLADGHVDDAERAAIGIKFQEQGARLDDAERFLADELANPASVDEIARAVATPEEAAEVYVTALLAVGEISTSERAFLARLALALKLDPELTPHLEAAVRAAKV